MFSKLIWKDLTVKKKKGSEDSEYVRTQRNLKRYTGNSLKYSLRTGRGGWDRGQVGEVYTMLDF